MTTHEYRKAVTAMIAEGCGLRSTDIRSDRPLIEYGLDSVRAIDLLISIEERFELTIPEETARYLKTIDDIVGYMQDRLAARAVHHSYRESSSPVSSRAA
jgi:acyl carrier protein